MTAHIRRRGALLRRAHGSRDSAIERDLCALADSKKSVANFNVAVREWNDDIIFLRKILPGQADKSYGIQVARLAGLPKPILDRAKEILSHLEMSSSKPSQEKKETPKAKKALPEADSPQMDLFG